MPLKPKFCLRRTIWPNKTACTFGRKWNFYCGKKVILSPKEGIFSETEKQRMTDPIKICLIFWKVFGEFQCRKGALQKSCATLHVWLSIIWNLLNTLDWLLVHDWVNLSQNCRNLSWGAYLRDLGYK